MFEKKAEEWVKNAFPNDEFKQSGISSALVEFAELGYNKANEWHFVKDGIMPEENQWVLVYDGSYTVCNYHSNTSIKWLDNYENEVYEGSIIAWKEIVTPTPIQIETEQFLNGGKK